MTAETKGTEGAATPLDLLELWNEAAEYWIDAWQRTVLTADTLRRRADAMLDHAAQGMPPLLEFAYEVLLDGRTQPRPVNVSLLRIVPPAGMAPRPGKAPIVIIDPRAGHGPGIGGFKQDSEVGIALEEGHPTYFVSFSPHPCPGQTLSDVEKLEVKFLEIVHERHPDLGRPIVYGNCQAGWATIMLGADRPDVTGPMVINGAPLSYWAGAAGVNPMRLNGGLNGGAWGALLLADLNAGELDGAWLVQNFESLHPARTYLTKLHDLYRQVDTERERFLRFERWWTGFYFLGADEIEWIVSKLFIGNDLEQGQLELAPGHRIDLRNLEDPVVVFASSGDDITPPHQALNWIWAIYGGDGEELKRRGQRIVYLLNPHVGHLGIFVSARVAQKEHRAIIESLDKIRQLPPGLYEMKILGETGEADPSADQWRVCFEERDLSACCFPYDRGEFEYTEQVSELAVSWYKAFVRPWVRTLSTPFTASWARWFHPARASRLVWSERLNPAMALLEPAARTVEANRAPAGTGNRFTAMEQANVRLLEKTIESWTAMRDAYAEALFKLLPPLEASKPGATTPGPGA